MRTIGYSECNSFEEVRKLLERAYQEIDEINFILAPEKAKLVKEIAIANAKAEKKAKACAIAKANAEARSKELANAEAVIAKAKAVKKNAKKATEAQAEALKNAKKIVNANKKGMVSMKTLLLLCVFVVSVFAGTVNAYVTTDINDDIASNHVLLAQYLRDSFANVTSNSFLFTPTTTANAPTASQGLVYFNSDTSLLQVSLDGAGFSPIDTAGGVSLDSAYDFGSAGGGRTINATDGAVQITNTENDTASLLGLTYSGNTTGDGMTITMSVGSGDCIEFENTGTGSDLEGTGATWSISKAGAFVGVGGTWTGDHLFTGSSKNIEVDVSQNAIHFLDDAVLAIGGATTAAGDFTFSYDGTDFNLEAAAANDAYRMGETTHFDLIIHGATNTNEVTFDTDDSALSCTFDGFSLIMNDNDILNLGDSKEFAIYYDEAGTDNLIIVALNANDAVQVGDGTTGTDFKAMAATSGDFLLFDASADELFFEDVDLKINEGAQIEFAVADNSIDWTIDVSTDETLLFLPTETTDDQTFNVGNATNTSDVRFFGATASTVVFDASADVVLFNVYNIALGDGDSLLFGDTLGTGDFSIVDTADKWVFDVVVAGVGEIEIGNDADDVPLKWFGETTGAFFYFTGDALQVDKADIAFSESDGLLFGDTLGTGDIRIDSTSALLTIGQVAAGTGSVAVGVDGAGLDWTFFGDTTLVNMKWTTASNLLAFTGQVNVATFEGTTVDAVDTILKVADPTTGNQSWIFPDLAANDDVSVIGSTLVTNAPEVANSVTGGTNQLIMEGATGGDGFQTIVTPVDATADRTITIPDKTGIVLMGSTVSVITAGTTPTLTIGLSNVYSDTITTDNQDQTITFSAGGTSGDRLMIIFTTDTGGSADEVITFEPTLVSATATLTLANVTAKSYVIEFVSNGTKWFEVSRTIVHL